MRNGPVIEWRTAEGPRKATSAGTITPVARSLTIRWPGGGAVWSGPSAVLIDQEGGIERIPIVNLNRRILWAVRAGAIALIAAGIVTDRTRRASNE